MYITTTLPTSEGAVYLQLVYVYSHYTTILAPNVDCSPCRFYFSMYIETKIIMQGLVYATRSDGPHQQVIRPLSPQALGRPSFSRHFISCANPFLWYLIKSNAFDVVLNNDSVLIDYSAQYKTPSPVSS